MDEMKARITTYNNINDLVIDITRKNRVQKESTINELKRKINHLTTTLQNLEGNKL